ncbi:hypothetical protein AB0M80_25255 [Amycolatopsis sp. NPDC051045]|uniref:hypothetical protein n=1 Tax=Amycolatopsis sp. NPDC051045 TaxID=3156922 RepID=UPI00344A9DAB
MPEPILISIAAALAAKGATGLYDLVKRKFAKNPTAIAALEAASAAPDDNRPITALAERLYEAEVEDGQFAEALREEWEKLPESRVSQGEVHNTVTGNVTGKVVQLRDVHGNINL